MPTSVNTKLTAAVRADNQMARLEEAPAIDKMEAA